MKYLFLGNNRTGARVLTWLKGQPDELAGMVIHDPAHRKYGDELLAAGQLPDDRIFLSTELNSKQTLQRIEALGAEMAVSILYGFPLSPEFLKLFPRGAINLHLGLLPFNRGTNCNIWSIVDRSPAGVTLHYIDEKLDTGDLIAQHELPVQPIDTGKTLYEKLELAAEELFKNTWPLVREGRAPRMPQHGKGSYHRYSDVEKIDRIELDRTYTARELIDILRARTFDDYPGAYFEDGGKRVYLKLGLSYDPRQQTV